MKLKISAKTLLIATALTLGAGASAFAMAPADGGQCGSGRGMTQGMQHGLQEMSKLHGDLKLDSKQEALWQDAEKASKGNIDGMRDEMRKQREAALASLNQPGADLRAVLRQMDAAKDAGRQQHEANRERWLAVYDSLNAEQKEKARLFFKSRLERMAHMTGAGRGESSRK